MKKQRCWNCGKALVKGKVDYCSSKCKEEIERKEEVVCSVCLTVYECKPNDGTDLCECPTCKMKGSNS